MFSNFDYYKTITLLFNKNLTFKINYIIFEMLNADLINKMKQINYSVFYKLLMIFFLTFSETVAASDTLSYKKELIRNNLATIESVYSSKQANQLIRYWNSIYPENKGKMYDFLSHYRWEKILKFNFQEAKKRKNRWVANQLAFALAVIYHRQTKFENAMPYMEEVLKNSPYLSKDQLRDVLKRQEYSFSATGNFDQALIVRKRRINNGAETNFWELYSAVGLSYEAINEFKLFEKEPTNDDFEKITYYNKLGTLFLNNRQSDSALFYFKKMENQASFIIRNNTYRGKSSYSEYVKQYLKALAISQQGECYLLEKKYKKAIPFLKTLLPYCAQIKEVDQKIIKWMSIAKSYNGLSKSNVALTYLDSVQQIITPKRMLNIELDAYKQYALSYKILGKAAAYNANMQNYFQLKDSIDFQNQKRRTLLLLTKYDVDQKKVLLQNERIKSINLEQDANNKKQIIVLSTIIIFSLLLIIFLVYQNYKAQRNAKDTLRKNNDILIISSKKIEEQSTKNEFLLKEIHHRIKNNLQMISSLLSLQKNKAKNPEVQMVLNDSKARIKTMALVHQQLYENEEVGIVSIENYLQDIVNNTTASYDCVSKFDFQINTPFSLSVDRSMYLGLITNEILTNSIKHNTAESIFFSIEMTQCRELIEYVITENGTGFDTIKKEGFGLKLIAILVRQIGATLTINSNKNEGLEHKIVFNEKE